MQVDEKIIQKVTKKNVNRTLTGNRGHGENKRNCHFY